MFPLFRCVVWLCSHRLPTPETPMLRKTRTVALHVRPGCRKGLRPLSGCLVGFVAAVAGLARWACRNFLRPHVASCGWVWCSGLCPHPEGFTSPSLVSVSYRYSGALQLLAPPAEACFRALGERLGVVAISCGPSLPTRFVAIIWAQAECCRSSHVQTAMFKPPWAQPRARSRSPRLNEGVRPKHQRTLTILPASMPPSGASSEHGGASLTDGHAISPSYSRFATAVVNLGVRTKAVSILTGHWRTHGFSREATLMGQGRAGI